MSEILVLYYSHRGSVRALAQQIARGIESTGAATARLRTVPRVAAVCTASEPEVPAAGAPYVEAADLAECIGPNTETALSTTRSGGTPYGASHLAGAEGNPTLSEDERQLAFAQGRRLASIALKLRTR